MNKILAVGSGLLSLVAYSIYNSQIFTGAVTPSLSAWLIFGFLVILNISSYAKMSRDWVVSFLPATNAFACLVTTAFVVAKGAGLGTLGTIDKLTLAIGLLACLVWAVFKKADYANVIVVSAVGIGFIPIYTGLYAGTVHEQPLPWFMWSVAYALSGVVVLWRWHQQPDNKNRLEMAYPAGCILMHLPVALLSM